MKDDPAGINHEERDDREVREEDGQDMARLGRLIGLAVAACVVIATLHAQTLSGPALIKSLQVGGHVIVMRHASSPRDVPPNPNPDNVPPERQLDEKGRTSATAMGDTLRRLKIPIGEVMTSPTYRARETARLVRLPNPRPATELGEGSGTMQAVSPAQTEWLQKRVREFPRGTNTVLVTHVPNITAAFPGETPAAAEGEAFVFGPDGKGGARLVGRIRIEDWTSF